MKSLFCSTVTLVTFCCIAPGVLEAATVYVASNGLDSSVCGGLHTPCRSISQAITNAFDGDRIVVGPGTYGVGVEGIEGFPGCVCMIKIDKSLTLMSRDGAEATVLDVGRADVRGVVIEANSVVFGKRNKGFTITNARREGVLLGGATSNVKVQGNVAIGNGSNGNDAFLIQGSAHTVVGNVALNNARGGFGIHGSEHTVTGNLASNNLQGAEVTFSGEFTRNAIVGNNLDGLVVNAVRRGLVIRRNDVLDNRQHGVRIHNPFDGVITQNNIFGNASTAGNCGLLNQSGGVVNAPKNFWGASSGPGPDPADAVCEDPSSTTIIDPVSTKEFNIRVQAQD